MSDREVHNNTARNGGLDGWWRSKRVWGLGALGAGTIGIIAYYAKRDGPDARILPPDDELCGDLFDDLGFGTQGGNCPGTINGRSEPVFSGQAPKHIDDSEMVAIGSLVVVAALFTLWYMNRNSGRRAAAY